MNALLTAHAARQADTLSSKERVRLTKEYNNIEKAKYVLRNR